MKLERSQFIKELKALFPELIPEINQEEGLFTFEIEAFCAFTQKKINDGEREDVARCFQIADKYYQDGNQKFQDIISTCFVENLNFKNTKRNYREWAWDLLPQALKDDYLAFHGTR